MSNSKGGEFFLVDVSDFEIRSDLTRGGIAFFETILVIIIASIGWGIILIAMFVIIGFIWLIFATVFEDMMNSEGIFLLGVCIGNYYVAGNYVRFGNIYSVVVSL
jgi:hypothetical protein